MDLQCSTVFHAAGVPRLNPEEHYAGRLTAASGHHQLTWSHRPVD